MRIPLVAKLAFISFLFFLGPMQPAMASTPDETIIITLEQPVYFLGADGSPVIANAGQYTVEAAEEWIKLIPGKERRNALLLETEKGTHEVGAEIPIALSIPGDNLDELNHHYVQLLLPNGTSLEANGTYDGVRPRGSWFSKAKARAKAKAAKARRYAARRYAAAKATAARRAAAVRAAALKAKQEAEQKARELALKAQQGAARLAKLAAIETCKAAFWTQQKIAWAEEQTLGRLRKEILKRLKEPKALKQLQARIDRWLMNLGGAVQGAMEASMLLNRPENLRLIKNLSNPKKLCTRSPKKTLNSVIRKVATQFNTMKRSSQVRSRGGTFRMVGVTIGGQFGLVKGAGGEIGVGGGIGFDGSTKGYGFVGGWAGLDAGASGAVQVGLWGTYNKLEKRLVENLKGPYFGMGYSGDFILKVIWPKLEKTIDKLGLNVGVDIFWDPVVLLESLDKRGGSSVPTGLVISAIAGGGFKDNALKDFPSVSIQGGGTFLFGK